MKRLVFAVAGYNLAETGRMIEIAREARNHFDIVFASYGGKFEELIEEEGFSAFPKMSVQGKVYSMRFKSIGGGMWEMDLHDLPQRPGGF